MIRSIFKKALMALTGLGLIGFLIAHLAGNLLIYGGPQHFNQYADMLETNPLLIPAEIGLLGIFLYHIFLAIKLTLENNQARPVGYQDKRTAGESTLASRTMMISGVIVLIFVIIHVRTFKYGENHINSQTVLWELVVKSFKDPLVATWYVVAMIVLGFHLSHGTSSAFNTLGWLKPGWRKPLRRAGQIVGWAIALGFAAFPIYVQIWQPTAPVTAPKIVSTTGSASPKNIPANIESGHTQ
jgi:succinate dehydrogenase / fumarate reductase cytochrome b subunit